MRSPSQRARQTRGAAHEWRLRLHGGIVDEPFPNHSAQRLARCASLPPLTVAFVGQTLGLGGAVSFGSRLAAELSRHNITVVRGLESRADAVLVFGGTRHLRELALAKRNGALVVQRLDGRNWRHTKLSYPAPSIGWRVSASAKNKLLEIIRHRIADQIIYQSEFSKSWWERDTGATKAPSSIIYNGVPLSTYQSSIPTQRRLVFVEGHFERDAMTRALLVDLHQMLLGKRIIDGSDAIGAMDSRLRRSVEELEDFRVHGVRMDVLDAMRESAVYVSADLNAACPNTVLEALSVGTPVAGFDTGALIELVPPDCGTVVPLRVDPWSMTASPDISGLAVGIEMLLKYRDEYGQRARSHCKAKFDIGLIADQYRMVLESEQ